MSAPCTSPGRPPDLRVAGDLDRRRTLRAVEGDRLTVLADEPQPQVQLLVRPVPGHVELDRDRGGRPRAGDAPASAVDVELAVGDHRVVGEQEGGPHQPACATLASAFLAFLKSRTFCSDAGSVTSATER